jgi:hypothetical protein
VPNQYYDNDLEAQRFQPGTTVSAEAVDAKLDEVGTGFEAVQQDTDRALKFPVEAGVSQEFAATKLQRRRKMLGFDAEGNLALTGVFNYRGDWEATTDYFLNDMLRDPTSKNLYVVTLNHTSGATFAATNMDLVINVEDVEAAKEAAETAESNAADSAGATAADRVATGQDATATGQDRSAASDSADAALASENKAEKWADEAVGVEVETGKYSSKHWADQAESIVLNGAFDDAATNDSQGWTSQKIQQELGVATTTETSKTIVSGERCFVTAATQTITLPATPSVNEVVAIGVQAFEDTVIARNGENIMGLAQNMVIDKENRVVTLMYVNATEGWRIV